MSLSAARLPEFPTALQTLGRAATEWTENKYGKAAKEIASLDLTGPRNPEARQTTVSPSPSKIDVRA